MYQDWKRRTIVLLIKPFVWRDVLVVTFSFGVTFSFCRSLSELPIKWAKTCSFCNMLNSFQSVIETLVQVLSLPYVKAESLGIGQWEEDPFAAIAPGLNGSSSLVMFMFDNHNKPGWYCIVIYSSLRARRHNFPFVNKRFHFRANWKIF